MLSRRSQRIPFYPHAKLSPAFPVQGIDELGDEPRRMIQCQQFIERRR